MQLSVGVPVIYFVFSDVSATYWSSVWSIVGIMKPERERERVRKDSRRVKRIIEKTFVGKREALYI
jgi:hypothetical protein